MLNYYERYEPDVMIAFNDLAKEAEALGCRVKYSDYVVPSIDRHVLQDDKGLLATLEVPDPHRDGRLPAFLEQCEALSAARFPSGLGAVLVGPDTYREFIKPYHQDMVNYFKAKKVGTTIHICGTTHQIHEDLGDVGFVAITIDLDQQADPTLKVDQLDKLVTLGNARNVV